MPDSRSTPANPFAKPVTAPLTFLLTSKPAVYRHSFRLVKMQNPAHVYEEETAVIRLLVLAVQSHDVVAVPVLVPKQIENRLPNLS